MTRRYRMTAAWGAAVVLAACGSATAVEKGWISLFDGKTFNGWKVTKDNPGTFTIADGAFVAKGNPAHLYYVGPVGNHDVKDFELKIDIKTRPKANGGVYFHTAWQERGWP